MFSKNKNKKDNLKVIQIAKVEWTKDDGIFTKGYVASPTFTKLVAVLNGYLINNILLGASDEYRRGYLACLQNVSNIGRSEENLEDSQEQTFMQDEYE